MSRDQSADNETLVADLAEVRNELEQECQRSQALMVLLEVLLKTEDCASIQKTANGVGLPEKDVFALCSASSDDALRRAIAQHVDAPGSVLQKLVKDKNDDVRFAVASNESTPGNALVWLAKNEQEAEVLLAVSRNEKMPANGLRLLSKNDDYNVRQAVASNESIPFFVGLKLARDDDKDVQTTILKASFSWMWFRGFSFRLANGFFNGAGSCNRWMIEKIRK